MSDAHEKPATATRVIINTLARVLSFRAFTTKAEHQAEWDRRCTVDKRGALVVAFAITSDVEYLAAGQFIRVAKQVGRDIAAHYVKIKQPINSLRTTVLDFEKTDALNWERAAELWEAEYKRYKRELEAAEAKRVRAEQDELDRIAREKRAQEVASLAAVAQNTADPALAAALAEEAEALAGTEIIPERAAKPFIPTAAGLPEVPVYMGQIDDPNLLIMSVAAPMIRKALTDAKASTMADVFKYLDELTGAPTSVVKIIQSEVDRVVSGSKGEKQIPGVTCFKDSRLVGRRV